MQLNDLLTTKGIQPEDVLVMRHRPTEPEMRKVLPWLAAERPELYNAYQQTQGPRAEKALTKAKYLASFIGHASGKALFIGLYRRGVSKAITYDQYWRIPAHRELRTFGMRGFDGGRPSILLFGLERTDLYAQWSGKLITQWPAPERAWFRWANRNELLIDAILDESLLDEKMPEWDELTLSWDELKVLPSKWKARLAEWRGIYLIFDVSDAKGYVGSAYGRDNMLGRWLNYAASGHGGNKRLRQRDPKNFRYSILQRVSPDTEAADVVELESSWKDRLHTREFGLNEN